mmetsp:Transcript_52625/g.128594  ORF Transcript_52625/g.128594 Transcript_52625/m.128594 type:complete len:252 (-) Transcript_52625:28-783(-)
MAHQAARHTLRGLHAHLEHVRRVRERGAHDARERTRRKLLPERSLRRVCLPQDALEGLIQPEAQRRVRHLPQRRRAHALVEARHALVLHHVSGAREDVGVLRGLAGHHCGALHLHADLDRLHGVREELRDDARSSRHDEPHKVRLGLLRHPTMLLGGHRRARRRHPAQLQGAEATPLSAPLPSGPAGVREARPCPCNTSSSRLPRGASGDPGAASGTGGPGAQRENKELPSDVHRGPARPQPRKAQEEPAA